MKWQQCGAKISTFAQKCPECGGPTTKLLKAADTLQRVGCAPTLLITIPVLILLFLLFYG